MRVRVLESDSSSTSLRVRFENDGDAGVVFQVYAAGSFDAPFNYTVARHSKLSADLPLSVTGAYDFTIYGPNGFIRRFAGMVSQASGRFGKRVARPSVDEQCDANSNKLILVLRNDGTDVCTFAITNRYDSRANVTKTVRGSDTQTLQIDLSASHGWYDLDISVNTDTTFARRIGGHVETGNESYSDPALAG
jgi:phospholipase C